MKMAKLHYDKDELIKDYQNVFAIVLKGMAIFFGVVLIYFLIFIALLGDKGHTPHGEFFDHFTKDEGPYGTRVVIEYEGKKLPAYDELEE